PSKNQSLREPVDFVAPIFFLYCSYLSRQPQ
ncbi:MAG: hypothetical protein ACI9MU_004459, partial [Alphaproteobacteria bacterium]